MYTSAKTNSCHGTNILNIISTRTITYDYNDKGARTKEVNLVRRRTRMYSSFVSELYSFTFVGCLVGP